MWWALSAWTNQASYSYKLGNLLQSMCCQNYKEVHNYRSNYIIFKKQQDLKMEGWDRSFSVAYWQTIYPIRGACIIGIKIFQFSWCSGDENQGECKDSWMIAWLQKIANNMTSLKKWLHKGLNAIRVEIMHSNEHIKVSRKFFAIIFSISLEKLILSLGCVWPNWKIWINPDLLVYLVILLSPSLKQREYSE